MEAARTGNQQVHVTANVRRKKTTTDETGCRITDLDSAFIAVGAVAMKSNPAE
jgi:hypothetical protein